MAYCLKMKWTLQAVKGMFFFFFLQVLPWASFFILIHLRIGLVMFYSQKEQDQTPTPFLRGKLPSFMTVNS